MTSRAGAGAAVILTPIRSTRRAAVANQAETTSSVAGRLRNAAVTSDTTVPKNKPRTKPMADWTAGCIILRTIAVAFSSGVGAHSGRFKFYGLGLENDLGQAGIDHGGVEQIEAYANQRGEQGDHETRAESEPVTESFFGWNFGATRFGAEHDAADSDDQANDGLNGLGGAQFLGAIVEPEELERKDEQRARECQVEPVGQISFHRCGSLL